MGIDAPVWEVAFIRVDGNQPFGDQRMSMFVRVDPDQRDEWLPKLPQEFQDDYRSRYVSDRVFTPEDVVNLVARASEGRALVCGSNPGIDMRWMERMALNAGHTESPFKWHYCPENIPTLARGWLNGKGIFPAPPWGSEFISQACGVDPTQFARHTALGDCEWTYALWKKVNAR